MRPLISALLFFILFVVWCVAFVPPNMDAFSPFHRIACWYVNAPLHTFREGCQLYLLDFGWFRYHRSFTFIGMTPNLLYFPFWALWKGPASLYAVGVGWLLLFAYGLVRGLRLPLRCGVIPLCYFPIAYLAIREMGPVRLTFVSAPALLWLADRTLDAHRTIGRVLAGAAAGVLIAICIEEKPFYILVLPTVLATVVACLWCRSENVGAFRASIVRAWPAGVSAAVVGALLASVLLLAGHDAGVSYWAQLRGDAARLAQSFRFELLHVGYYTAVWPSYGRRVFDVEPLSGLLRMIWIGLISLGIVWCWRSSALSRRALLLFGGAWLIGSAVFVAARTPNAPHHFVFLHLPVVTMAMVAASGSQRAFRTVVYGVLACSAFAMATLTAKPIYAHSARDRDDMFDYLSRPDVAQAYVINFSTWGGYYQQSLYGDREQLVTYIDPLTREKAEHLVAIAKGLSRGIIDACLDCDATQLSALFAPHAVSEAPLRLSSWRLFRIDLRDAASQADQRPAGRSLRSRAGA